MPQGGGVNCSSLSLFPLLLIENQAILSMYNFSSDAKEEPQDCRQPIQPMQGMQIPHHMRGDPDVISAFSLADSLCLWGAEGLD